MTKLSIVCILVMTAACVHAQQATPAATASGTPPRLPPGPLLKPVPDHTRWTVSTVGKVAQDAKPEEKEAGSTVIVGEISGKAAHVVTVIAKVRKEEKWSDGKLLATMKSGAKEPFYTTAAIDRIPMPSWITAGNFAEIKTVGTKDYLIFRAKIVPAGTEIIVDLEKPNPESIENLKVDATATIDGDTRLPIAVKEGENTTTYRFEPLAPDAQIIPEAIQASLAERGKKMQDSIRKPVRP